MNAEKIQADQERAESELAAAETRARVELAQKRRALAEVEERARLAQLSDIDRAHELRRADLRKQLAAANKAGDHDAHRKRIAKAHEAFRRAASELTASVEAIREAYDLQHDAAHKARGCARELQDGAAVGPVAAEERIAQMERDLAAAFSEWLEVDDSRRLRVRPTAIRRPNSAWE